MSLAVSRALNRAAVAANLGIPAEPAPVRIAHLGLGAFHRAHQAWYTSAADGEHQWGIRAFTGRSPQVAEELAAQDGLYSLVVRSDREDQISIIDSISDAQDGARVDRLLETLAAEATALVTITISEAGYALDSRNRPDLTQAQVAADVAWLRENLPAAQFDLTLAPRTTLARLLVGLEARRRAGGGALAIVSCDNLPGNGALTREALLWLAEYARAPFLADYLREAVAFVSTSVDRITPKTTAADVTEVRERSGWEDRSPVVSEPFHDWVLSGDFPAGRPSWERAGARFVTDVEPFERRKLWLLNGAHSLLAYAGMARGHRNVAQAIGDPQIREWVEELWAEAARQLPAEGLDLDTYRAALLARFENGRIEHRLSQIGMDGTTKLRVRTAPIVRAERAAGRTAPGSVQSLGAWVALARTGDLPPDSIGTPLQEAAQLSGTISTPALLALIDPELAADPATVAAVHRAAASFTPR